MKFFQRQKAQEPPQVVKAERTDGLSPEEGAVMDHLVAAVEAYGKLPPAHPAEPHEFVDAIHRILQDFLAWRAMAGRD